MDRTPAASAPVAARPAAAGVLLRVLLALSFSHLLNDTLQSLIPALYPLLKTSYGLSFTQIGLITFAFQVTASLLQPLVGIYTDRRAMPYSLAAGMGLTLLGLILLSQAHTFAMLVAASALVGMGSSIFHPEASRLARLASGGRHGFAQSLFQVGGNLGSSLGPLLAAWVVVPRGQGQLLWFTLLALLGIAVLARVGGWYRERLRQPPPAPAAARALGPREAGLPRGQVLRALAVLVALIFSKYVYLVSLTSYYTFYLIATFGMSVQRAQIHLFIFLFAVAAGTIAGGPLGDRYGRKYVIWISILGVAPFTLALPYANVFWAPVLAVLIGLILASAFSAILVYAQELVPGKVGLIAGIFFGFAFGIAGIGSALLGALADRAGIREVFQICSFLPLLGLLTAFLPDLESGARGGNAGNSPRPA